MTGLQSVELHAKVGARKRLICRAGLAASCVATRFRRPVGGAQPTKETHDMKVLAIGKLGRTALVAATAALALGTAANVAGASQRASTVTLTVWDWSSPAPNVMKGVDDAFTKANPGIVIKRVHQPFNSYFTLLRTAVATRKGPDIMENYASPLLFDYY